SSEMDEFPLPYSEGAAVGYKWMDANKIEPLFPFGHGLSYTTFGYGPITAVRGAGGRVRVRFTLRNTGRRAGMAVGQVYASPVAGSWEAPKRLVAFAKVELPPGASKSVDVEVDPRLLGTFDEATHTWRIAPGRYRLMLGASSGDLRSTTTLAVAGLTLPANWRPAGA